MNNFEAITFTTFGYKDYTENLIASINKNQIDLDVNVYTLDNKSHEYFSRFHNNLTPFVKDSHPKEFMDQKNSDFGELMLKKFECIFDSLNKYEYVLYLDSDIVIKRNIREYLINMIGRKDILFQNDKNPKKPNQINLCAGFMMIKSNKSCSSGINSAKSRRLAIIQGKALLRLSNDSTGNFSLSLMIFCSVFASFLYSVANSTARESISAVNLCAANCSY